MVDDDIKIELRGVRDEPDDPRRLRALLQAMAGTKSSDGLRVEVAVRPDEDCLLSLVVTAPFEVRERELAEVLGPVFREELQRMFNEIASIARDREFLRSIIRDAAETLSAIGNCDCDVCDAGSICALSDRMLGALCKRLQEASQ